ncbi:MAG: UDP-N-acetylmuramoyl-tripeptide--D-alanyl-D-alanine ligase [Bdellovibrionales bacterium]
MSGLTFFLFAAFAYFAWCRLLQYLHIFQQEEYNSRRFWRWIVRTRAFDRRVSGALLAVVVLGFFLPPGIEELLIAAAFILFSFFENDPRKSAKKKLVITKRARRIFGIALGFCFAAGAMTSQDANPLLWIVVVQLMPLSLMLSNSLLAPVEDRIQRKILEEARAIVAKTNPKVIGITGSFGKTSVKHILGHVLELNAPTLFTPGSVNTLMGISRIVREKLTPDIRYFLAEMGAYGQGSIEKLCGLTPPHCGIITAIGEAHFERFKTLDSVARAKFELAEAVVSHDEGKMIVQEGVLAQEYARMFVEKHRAQFIVCGRDASADLKIGKVEQTASGLTVSVQWQEKNYDLFAPLHGAVHADNMALAFVTALMCGVTAERAVAALRTTPQIAHRLEVKPLSDGTVYIDDAYNSNPQGFASALDLLSVIASEKKARRILVTPGVVELGEKNDEIHRALGEKAAQNADVVLVVRADKIPTFIEGFKSAAANKEAFAVASFKEAREWLGKNVKAPDVILLENDLPDVDETKLAL